MFNLRTFSLLFCFYCFLSYSNASEFVASSDFSSTQGQNGWSYAAVLWSGTSDLYSNQVLGTYDSGNSRWSATVPSAATVHIDANGQDMTEGNAVFSLRYWTADQDYDSVEVISTLYGTVTCGAQVLYVDASTSSTTSLVAKYIDSPSEQENLDCIIDDVKQGDRIYFMLQNSGDGQGSHVMQNWDQRIIAPTADPQGKSYYIDSVSGSDSNDGLSTSTPWQTLAKVNSITFRADDEIYFKAGSSFTGTLTLRGSGREGFPIIVDMYGSGDKPCIDGDGNTAAITLYNSEYWEINNLEIMNTAEQRSMRQGIRVILQNYSGTADHIYLKNLYIHNVYGNLSRGDGDGSGIFFQNYQTGGTIGNFNDILIEDCYLYQTDRNGILITGCQTRTDWNPNTNVVIRNNKLEDIAGDGIFYIGCDSPLVEHNFVDGAGMRCPDSAAGIWPANCDDAVVQYNEVCGMSCDIDAEGFDSDYRNRNAVFQYNYSHDNEGGFMLICDVIGDSNDVGNDGTIVRYNISQNDGDGVGIWSGLVTIFGPVKNAKIYNNVMYVDPAVRDDVIVTAYWPYMDYDANNISFANNIFYLDGQIFREYYTPSPERYMHNVTYYSNVYYGDVYDSLPSDAYAITSDPMLVDVGSGSDGMDTLDGYKITDPNSPCIEAGTAVSINEQDYLNGGLDFWGDRLAKYIAPDVGAYSYSRPFEFLASEGFSGTQGENGWSYAGVHFADIGDLYGEQVMCTYNSTNEKWAVTISGAGTVNVNADSQDMREGNAVFSLRYWTADQDYKQVEIISTLNSTVTCGAKLLMVDEATKTTTLLTGPVWAVNPPQSSNINYTLTDVKYGDRVYFMLQNSGDGQGSNVMQQWDPLIIATPESFDFQASTDFSDTQGENGWSYAAVHFSGIGDLYNNQAAGAYDSNNSWWVATVPSVASVKIDSDSQCMTEGNAVFSLRYWTADQDYRQIDISSTLNTTVTCGARLLMVDAATKTTTNLSSIAWAVNPPQSVEIEKNIVDIKCGDRIYFMLQNSGDGQGSGVMQQWDPVITVLPEPN